MRTKAKVFLTAVAVTTLLGGGLALAQHKHGGGHDHGAAKAEQAGGHDHGQANGSEAAIARLKLNGDKKWQTDAALQNGMVEIRKEIEAAIPTIHADKYSPEQYAALAKKIEGQVSTIVATCKLDDAVDEQFHFVVADLYGGATAMKKDGDRTAGAVKVINALDAYGKYFDHAGWTRVKH